MQASTGHGTFAILKQVHAGRGFETAFREATGLWVRLQPLPRQASALLLEPDDNPLCQLACSTSTGRAVCHRIQGEVRHAFEAKLGAHPVSCIAGLTILAVPVRMCGEYVATLHTNRILTRSPGPADVQRFAKVVTEWGGKVDLGRLRADFARIPVVEQHQLQALIKLLSIYAEHLGDLASRRMLADQRGRPCPVAQALAYIREHLDERMSLRTVAQRAGLSPFYFCKLFHRTLGMTFTEYLVRSRLERAKDLLLSPAIPVSDIAISAGFGSIPHFNRAFKRYTGTTPTAYRNACSGPNHKPVLLSAAAMDPVLNNMWVRANATSPSAEMFKPRRERSSGTAPSSSLRST